MSAEESDLRKLIGKQVSDIEWSKFNEDEILNLRSVTFTDGTVMEFHATDYDNIVMVFIKENKAMRFWTVDKENGKVTLETPEGVTVTFINLDEVETVARMLLDEVEEMEDGD